MINTEKDEAERYYKKWVEEQNRPKPVVAAHKPEPKPIAVEKPLTNVIKSSNSHSYKRHSIRYDHRGFVGWDELQRVIEQISGPKHQALAVTIFETGGRIEEVTHMTKGMIKPDYERQKVYVSGMLLEKNRDREGNPHSIRPMFDFPFDPLTPIMLDWCARYENDNDLLFPCCDQANVRKKFRKAVVTMPDGHAVRLFPHLLRGIRASSLYSVFKLQPILVKRFFSHKKLDTSLWYMALSCDDLDQAYDENRGAYEESFRLQQEKVGRARLLGTLP